MIDPVLVIYVSLVLSTVCMILLYYRKVRQASKEYMKAKKVLDDIVLSFNRELRNEGEKIREITQKNNAKLTETLDAVSRFEPRVTDLEARLKKIEETSTIITSDHENMKKKIDDLSMRHTEPLKEAIVTSVAIGGQESEILGAPPIPLRRERALASLTDTEVQILELLARQGEKTAVQIRDEIKLTREHTARLMKKLYNSGYVERRTDRTPYVYRLKKEMEGLLDTSSL
jgi:DNA-binding transcriptional ArsR family regulator